MKLKHPVIVKLNGIGLYIRKTPAHRDELSNDDIDKIHELVDDPFNDIYKALKALTEWGREHTSPLDANSPHQLLIRAVAALEAVDKEQSLGAI